MLRKMTEGQRGKFLEEEAAAANHDAMKSKHVLKTTGIFRAAGGNPLAAGRGGRGGKRQSLG